MGYIPGTNWNNRHRFWFITTITLLSCIVLAACDTSNVNGNNGSCNGNSNQCIINNNSNSTVNTGTSSGSPVLPPTPTPTPSPTATPEPRAYKADWSNGMDGWVQSGGWSSVNGMLVNDGTDYDNDGHPTAIAPTFPQDITNYSVQVDIRLDRYTDEGGMSGLASFGVVVRWSQDQNRGYKIGACASGGIFSCGSAAHELLLSNGNFFQDPPVKQAPFRPAYGDWHTYKINVQGNTITAWVDGGMIFQVTDDKYLSAGNVGLWSYRSQISVRNFTITAL